MTFECTDEMVIAKFLVSQGDEVNVGDPIMVTVEEGDISAFSDFVAPTRAGAPGRSSCSCCSLIYFYPPAAPGAAAPPATTPTPAVTAPRAAGERVAASPLARRPGRSRNRHHHLIRLWVWRPYCGCRCEESPNCKLRAKRGAAGQTCLPRRWCKGLEAVVYITILN